MRDGETSKRIAEIEQRRDAAFQRLVERMKKRFGYDDQTAIEATRNWLNFAQHMVRIHDGMEQKENSAPDCGKRGVSND
jgi:hypothetical protein